jgi:predicted DNA-binding transcriptional regulator AlpA
MQQNVTRRGAAVPIDPREYPERLLPENEAAEILGVVPGTLANWRARGIGPEYVRLGSRTIRYTREAIEAFAKTELIEREPADELSDADLVRQIARLANRLARRQRLAKAA